MFNLKQWNGRFVSTWDHISNYKSHEPIKGCEQYKTEVVSISQSSESKFRTSYNSQINSNALLPIFF